MGRPGGGGGRRAARVSMCLSFTPPLSAVAAAAPALPSPDRATTRQVRRTGGRARAPRGRAAPPRGERGRCRARAAPQPRGASARAGGVRGLRRGSSGRAGRGACARRPSRDRAGAAAALPGCPRRKPAVRGFARPGRPRLPGRCRRRSLPGARRARGSPLEAPRPPGPAAVGLLAGGRRCGPAPAAGQPRCPAALPSAGAAFFLAFLWHRSAGCFLAGRKGCLLG